MGSADNYYLARPENSDGHGYAGIARLSWTVELANKRRTFKTQEACMFLRHGFEEGTGEPRAQMSWAISNPVRS